MRAFFHLLCHCARTCNCWSIVMWLRHLQSLFLKVSPQSPLFIPVDKVISIFRHVFQTARVMILSVMPIPCCHFDWMWAQSYFLSARVWEWDNTVCVCVCVCVVTHVPANATVHRTFCDLELQFQTSTLPQRKDLIASRDNLIPITWSSCHVRVRGGVSGVRGGSLGCLRVGGGILHDNNDDADTTP